MHVVYLASLQTDIESVCRTFILSFTQLYIAFCPSNLFAFVAYCCSGPFSVFLSSFIKYCSVHQFLGVFLYFQFIVVACITRPTESVPYRPFNRMQTFSQIIF